MKNDQNCASGCLNAPGLSPSPDPALSSVDTSPFCAKIPPASALPWPSSPVHVDGSCKSCGAPLSRLHVLGFDIMTCKACASALPESFDMNALCALISLTGGFISPSSFPVSTGYRIAAMAHEWNSRIAPSTVGSISAAWRAIKARRELKAELDAAIWKANQEIKLQLLSKR